MAKETMPERVTVNIPVTFDVQEVIATIAADNRMRTGEASRTVTVNDVLCYVQEEALSFYRNARWKDTVTVDQDGQEL